MNPWFNLPVPDSTLFVPDELINALGIFIPDEPPSVPDSPLFVPDKFTNAPGIFIPDESPIVPDTSSVVPDDTAIPDGSLFVPDEYPRINTRPNDSLLFDPSSHEPKALRATHVERGHNTLVFDDKRIDLVIRGGKRFYGEGEKRLRLPLTGPILRQIVNEIRADYGGINLKAVLCVAFAGFLRSGEFTWDSPINCLPRSSIVFNFDNSVTLTLLRKQILSGMVSPST